VSNSSNYTKDVVVFFDGQYKIRDRKTNGKYYVIDWGGLTDVENIYNFLYKDAKTYLDRKKEKYDKAIVVNSLKNRYRKNKTN